MGHSVFDGCSDGCGWIAAILACLTFGSYGVTIKESNKKDGVEADPLVMQTYKTLVFFLSCFFVTFLGEEIVWTNWGLISGLLWVPGATFGIYGVMYAGMATAEGTWSSVIVIVNFFWGICVFHEGVKSFTETCFAFLLLTIGLVGMSIYSSPSKPKRTKRKTSTMEISPVSGESFISTDDNDTEADSDVIPDSTRERSKATTRRKLQSAVAPADVESNFKGKNYDSKGPKDRFIFFNGKLILTRRHLGIIAAAINGLCGGTSLIPMHYAAQEGYSGARYFVSYATGSFIVNLAIWILLLLYRLVDKGSVKGAIQSLPPWHFKDLWFPGLMSGILFSVGMFGSIISVAYLGQGIGNTCIQVKIMVAGLWGLLYYKEIKGAATITKWFTSAMLALTGILVLSHEHKHLPHH